MTRSEKVAKVAKILQDRYIIDALEAVTVAQLIVDSIDESA